MIKKTAEPAIVDTFIAPPCHDAINILYEDEYLLLIDKPSGLLSLSGKNPLNKDSVHYRLKQQYPSALMTHRLDFGTSGIMLIALNKAVNAHITKQFQNRSIEKTYISVLSGHLINKQGVIDQPIAKDSACFPRQKICHSTGKPARSQYRVIARTNNPDTTRVSFKPLTGRTHQLRIHSQSIGHPIAGCDLYGNSETQAMSERLMLHAASLQFEHPATAEIVRYDCICPF